MKALPAPQAHNIITSAIKKHLQSRFESPITTRGRDESLAGKQYDRAATYTFYWNERKWTRAAVFTTSRVPTSGRDLLKWIQFLRDYCRCNETPSSPTFCAGIKPHGIWRFFCTNPFFFLFCSLNPTGGNVHMPNQLQEKVKVQVWINEPSSNHYRVFNTLEITTLQRKLELFSFLGQEQKKVKRVFWKVHDLNNQQTGRAEKNQ